jgi:hypothetical protein
LNKQEEEFAAACRHFVLEREPGLDLSIIVTEKELAISSETRVRQAFLEFGLAKMIRVFQLAIERRAMPLRRVPKLLFDIFRFRKKILRILK